MKILISGMDADLDLEDLQRHTVLEGYTRMARTVKNLWKCLNKWSEQDKRLFLRYVTRYIPSSYAFAYYI